MSGAEQHSEILTTPWFKLIAKKAGDSPSPYYVIQSTDSELIHSIESGKIKQALDVAVIFLGIQKNKLSPINSDIEQASV